MAGDLLKKRKIAVRGSRSVGWCFLRRHSSLPSDPRVRAGKSSLVVQYIENIFVESYYPTIEATFSKSIKYKGQEYDCDIIDTAGQVCPRAHSRVKRCAPADHSRSHSRTNTPS